VQAKFKHSVKTGQTSVLEVEVEINKGKPVRGEEMRLEEEKEERGKGIREMERM